ncbi:MAG: hypothetical protein OHK0053_16040 [Microscillaceae bacterium]
MTKFLITFSLIWLVISGQKEVYGQNQSLRDSVSRLLRRQASPARKLQSIFALHPYLKSRNPVMAIELGQEALRLGKQLRQDTSQYQALLSLAEVHGTVGERNQQLQYLYQALSLAEKLKNTPYLIRVLNQLALASLPERLPEAESYLDRALELARLQPNREILIEQNLVRADFEENRQQFSQGLHYAQMALRLSQKKRDSVYFGKALLKMARLYNMLREFELARQYAEQAETLARKAVLDVFFQSLILTERGKAEFGAQQYDEAQAFFEAALQLSYQVNAWPHRAEILERLVQNARKQQKPETALAYFEAYLQLYDSLRNDERAQQLTRVEALLDLERKNRQIDQLTRSNQSRQTDLVRQTYIRNAFIIFSGMILLASFVFFRLYRQKAHINQRLAQQNEAMQQQSERIMEHQKEVERVNKMLILQNYEITLKNQAIENQNQDIKDSIEYAQRIQSAMLPSAEKLQKILPDYFILFKPKDIVSGDFYWIHQEEEKVLVAVVDCTGHGVPGAFMSLIGNELLNDIIIQRKIFSPEKALDELHQRVRFALNQGETQNKDGMDLALCQIDYQKKELLFAGAYNPIMVIQGGQLEVIAGDNNPIGGWHSQGASRHFKNKVISLREETLVYLYSDGYQDQFGGPQGRKLMKSRFRKLIESIHTEPMGVQHRVLEKTIGNWMQGHAQVDDILVMGIRIRID